MRWLLRWLLARLPGRKRMWDMVAWKDPREKALRLQLNTLRPNAAYVNVAIVAADDPDHVLWEWENVQLRAMTDALKAGRANIVSNRVVINLDAECEVAE